MAEDGCPDMVDIDELNNATLLYNLGNRYKRDDIYVYVGPILLALNPFKGIKGLNDNQNMLRYKEICESPTPLQLKKKLPPHIFTITALAYRNLKELKKRQAIVISGESGAGKTESAKIAMNFLTQVTVKPG